MNNLLAVSEIPVISFGKPGEPIFELKREDGTLNGYIHKPEALNEAAKIFFNELKIEGKSLYNQVASLERFIGRIHEMAKENPNDMEFGKVVRELLRNE